MSPDRERWERVSRLFDEAIDLPAEERVRLVAARCAGDAGLRAEVEALLRAEESVGEFLEGGPRETGTLLQEIVEADDSGGRTDAAPRRTIRAVRGPESRLGREALRIAAQLDGGKRAAG